MNVDAVTRELMSTTRGTLLVSEPMSSHTSFRIGGPADVFFVPSDEEDIRVALRSCSQHGVPVTVIGGGTNLLVSDLGIEGLVLRIEGCLAQVTVQGNYITAGAGAPLCRVASVAAEHSLTGLEFAVGIPGTVAGAVAMNSAAHGRSMSDVVSSVRVLRLDGTEVVLQANECEFGEKTSVFQRGELIILEVILRLSAGDQEEIRRLRDRYARDRRAKQPLNYPSAGCVFRNPAGGGAGRYIDQAGCKGLRVGDAEVSRLHANFIVNLGCATASDVTQLIEQVQKLVIDKVGVRLEPEIRFIGR
ncbi:MAG: UDP-N-acetylmuramate dehydrogenase [Bacillota bacterium]|jgi:UDP-N-acetylmuramate dehydrogenase|nr:UDP-N-acetylmuramate dehydrogenase [Bacillota bacterium]